MQQEKSPHDLVPMKVRRRARARFKAKAADEGKTIADKFDELVQRMSVRESMEEGRHEFLMKRSRPNNWAWRELEQIGYQADYIYGVDEGVEPRSA